MELNVAADFRQTTVVNNGVHPLLSIHDIDGFQKRQEQEAVLELRKRAITRWLKQLPSQAEELQQKTMWASFHSFGDLDDSVQALQRGQESCDLDGYVFEDSAEETPLDAFEKKSMPTDVDECPIRGLKSMKQDPECFKRSLSQTIAFHDCNPPPPARFSQKHNDITTATKSKRVIEVKTSADVSGQTSKQAIPVPCAIVSDVSEEDWSAMSDCCENPIQNEDTAYGGSSSDWSGTKQKYETNRSTSPIVNPPRTQSIQSSIRSDSRPFTTANLKADAGLRSAVAPEGEWWMPNVFFRNLIEMFDDDSSNRKDDDSEEDEQESAWIDRNDIHDRVLRRLAYRRCMHCKRCGSAPRRPSHSRLHCRMQQAKRHGEAKHQEVHCTLKHLPKMKSMVPNGKSAPNPLTPPQEIQAMDYQPPSSVADLSDFECYVGPMLSALVEQTRPHHPAVAGQCQTWLLEKLLCFLGGKATLS